MILEIDNERDRDMIYSAMVLLDSLVSKNDHQLEDFIEILQEAIDDYDLGELEC